ncbi:type II toxin-antitoxin system Phd/YefM family antitoxin [Actinotalea sp. Marseille-Q4924]|uniref:type II toxin-antitoxin system Phd/YefM family antitoxin n=1 Tax=Actinotalea sp. Marseille-Q4924 TaxID=2866571 RepID=UPI001CE4214A|nr:type II toxin-antitoxin system prevent-host-death family antitoxin [Actinotalea sp. Marseille-Q4924]
MDDTVGIRALKQNASSVVARTAAGETITVTDRGRPVARLAPIPRSPLEEMLQAGEARPARRSPVDLAHPRDGAALSTELAAMREAERT